LPQNNTSKYEKEKDFQYSRFYFTNLRFYFLLIVELILF